MPNNVDFALHYLGMGWSVFPISRDKVPLVKWSKYQKQLASPDEIREWWSRWPDAGIGVATGKVSNLLVVDVDESVGVGLARQLPDTLISRTGGGGVHMFYRCDGQGMGQYVRIRPGIDIRCNGGYAVVAPSVHKSGKPYTWANTNDPAPLPAEVLDWCANPDPKSGIPYRNGAAAPVETNPWQQVISSGQRNAEMTRRVGKLVSLGVPPDDVMTFMSIWNNKHCKPPLPNEELKGILVKLMGRHDQSAGAFDAISLDEMARKYAATEVEWLVDGWIPSATVGLITAPPGTWKTWMLLDLSVSIASGKPFLGCHKVHSVGPVLIVQQEDPFTMLVDRISRMLGMGEIEKHGDTWDVPMPPIGLPIFWHTKRQLNFNNKTAMEGLRAKIAEIKPRLVFIDPLYSVINLEDYGAGGAQQMLEFKSIRDEFGCAFMIAHHTKKTLQTGGRTRDDLWGSQFLNAWLETGWQIRPQSDTEITVTRHFKAGEQVPPTMLKFDVTPNSYDVTVSDVDEADEPDIVLRVLAEIRKNDVTSIRQLATRLGLNGQGTLSRILKKQGIEKNNNGVYAVPAGSGDITK